LPDRRRARRRGPHDRGRAGARPGRQRRRAAAAVLPGQLRPHVPGGLTAREEPPPLESRAVVVLAGSDGVGLGTFAGELEARGARVAVFVGDLSDQEGRAALLAMLDELFAGRWYPRFSPRARPAPGTRELDL